MLYKWSGFPVGYRFGLVLQLVINSGRFTVRLWAILIPSRLYKGVDSRSGCVGVGYKYSLVVFVESL